MDTILSYLGTGWAFPPAFVKDNGVQMVSDEEDIDQSLQILLSTSTGERIFRFDYGCNIRQWVFDEINLSQKNRMIDHITQAILYYEPRIKVEKVDIDFKDQLEGILWISIDYCIHKTNHRSNRVYPFYFNEGTNL